MNVNIESLVSGKILSLEVRDKHGNLKTCLKDIPNIITQGIGGNGELGNPGTAYTMASTAESYEDLDGTWNQVGNTLSRASGTGTFPSSPDQLGNELYWYNAGANTGHRVHVTARSTDAQVTVSGPSKTINGGSLRRYITNGAGVNSTSGAYQSSASNTKTSDVYNDVSGTHTKTYRYNFNSATSGYTFGSIVFVSFSRVKLPATVTIEAEDQLQFTYQITVTISGRSQIYELGAESVGVPNKYAMTSIVGNGTYVDVTFSEATPFLAGDKLDLRNIVTKRISISSASSTSTTFTISATAHGLNVGDSVTIENASLAGYNGVFAVATVVDSDTFTITDASNPGTMGAAGTVRLTTPIGFFNTLGIATIASMQSTTVARITSTVTGVEVDPAPIGGDPGITVKFQRSTYWGFESETAYLFNEANAKAVLDETVQTETDTTTNGTYKGLGSGTSAAYSNDWTRSVLFTWNAGVSEGYSRLKQILIPSAQFSAGTRVQMTFNTPLTKTTAQRLRFWIYVQTKRAIVTP